MLEIEIVESNIIDGGIEVFARAWRDGQQIGFGKDGTIDIERFRIFNPPVLVQDPLGPIVRESIKNYGEPDEEIVTTNYREDPEEALLQSLTHTIGLVGKDGSNIVAGTRGNTTSTFYPNTATGIDSYAQRGSVDENWATIRAGAGNSSGAAIDFYPEIGMRVSLAATTRWRTIARAIILIDTSAIGTDNVDSAVLSLWGTANTHDWTPTTGTLGMRIVTSSPASDTAVANSDYANLGTTAQANDIASGSLATGAYNDFTFNATGEGNINKTGLSKFGYRHTRDADNDEPTGATVTGQRSIFSAYNSTRTGTANDPKLVVEHSASGGSATPTLMMMGIGS